MIGLTETLSLMPLCVSYECHFAKHLYAKHNFVALLCWACSECLFAKYHYAEYVKSVFLLNAIMLSAIMVSVIV